MAANVADWLRLRVRVEPQLLPPGERGTLVVDAEIPGGCHIEAHEPTEPFLVPTEIVLEPVDDVVIGPATYPAAEEQRFEWTPAVLRVYRGSIRIEAPVVVAEAAVPGPRTVRGRLRYQGCTPATCLMPNAQPVETVIEVARSPSQEKSHTDAAL